MSVLMLIATLSCPKTVMINRSKLLWNSWDRNRERYCEKRCSYEYSDAPCLKKFIKLGYQNYFCLCGVK